MKLFVFAVLAMGAAGAELDRPAGITVHTWVREDIFAALLGSDWPRLELGARKLDRILEQEPDEKSALGWRTSEYIVRAVKALDAGDRNAAGDYLQKAEAIRAKVTLDDKQSVGAQITIGATLILMAPRLPEDRRAAMYREGLERLKLVRQLQAPAWDKIPIHMRGEMLSLIGFASDQLGDKAERDRMAAEMAAAFPGTAYADRAKRWNASPKLSGAAQVLCLSCHESGRLQARLDALKK